MSGKTFSRAIGALCVLVLVSSAGAFAQPSGPPHFGRFVHFTGIINDYSPSIVSGGPYEIRGNWSLDWRGQSANFSAAVTMETSDSGITVDLTNPDTRGAHTHHITMTNAKVTYNSDPSVCPAYNPATTSPNLVVTGPVSITGNGNPAPFESKGPSTMQVCINGGSVVPFSNISLVLVGPATGHFGTQAIHGVVRKVQ
ncbi:MAG: hypothetical protein ACRD20_08575 [Terriglobales bacterium]